MDSAIVNYAPIVIPTLCRVNTFVPCIESLSKCVGAENTDVYIALDFPLKECHWEGYLQILNYLGNTKFPFKTLNVVKRSENLGVYGPNSNINQIFNLLWENYDRLIFSEDDNIFAPNFLIYINQGLERFENDFTVDSICGYLKYNGVKTKDNTFYRCPNVFSAWGYATWKNRKKRWDELTTQYYRKSLSLKNLIKMAELGRSRFLEYLAAMSPVKYLWLNDVNLGIYMILENKCQIVPTISLVKNIGVMSGENFSECSQEIADLYLKQNISDDKTFEFIGTGYECQKENVKEWVNAEKLFHEKYHWITWDVFIKLALKRIVKIFLGTFGWQPNR